MSDLALDESTKVLESHGLYVDDLSRVRVVDQDTADSSSKWPSDFLTFFCRNREKPPFRENKGLCRWFHRRFQNVYIHDQRFLLAGRCYG